MGARGRQSKSELSVVSDKTIELVERPNPPERLSPEQKEVWKHIVGNMPADWFRPETYELLVQRCRHSIEADDVSQMIWDLKANADEFHLDKYDKLLKMQERESRAILSIDTKLRLTLQATRSKDTQKPALTKKPWEAK